MNAARFGFVSTGPHPPAPAHQASHRSPAGGLPWWSRSDLRRRGRRLDLGGTDLHSLAEQRGTPLYTDARLYGERGVPTVLYGAGPRTVLESNAKRADENLLLEDLRRATKVVACALRDLLQPAAV